MAGMRAYLDCPDCSCLVVVTDPSCPFCGHLLRSAAAPRWLGVGLALSLGSVSGACSDKGDDTDGVSTTSTTTSTTSSSSSSSSSTSSSTSSDTTTQGNDSIDMVTETFPEPDGNTYAGPDETFGTDPIPGTTSTTTTTASDDADGSTYAGPDENTTIHWETSGTGTTEVPETGSETGIPGSETTTG